MSASKVLRAPLHTGGTAHTTRCTATLFNSNVLGRLDANKNISNFETKRKNKESMFVKKKSPCQINREWDISSRKCWNITAESRYSYSSKPNFGAIPKNHAPLTWFARRQSAKMKGLGLEECFWRLGHSIFSLQTSQMVDLVYFAFVMIHPPSIKNKKLVRPTAPLYHHPHVPHT